MIASESLPEEASLAPVGAPGVASDPVVRAVLTTPSIQLNGVISGGCSAGIVHDDSTGVYRGLQAVGIDVRRDRAAGVDFSANVVVPRDRTELRNGDVRVVRHGVASSATRITVHAGVVGRALHVLGLVLLAGDVWNTTVLVHPRIGGIRVASATVAGIAAVDHDLYSRDHVALQAFSGDFDAVGDRGQRRMGPARSTVSGDMLETKFKNRKSKITMNPLPS